MIEDNEYIMDAYDVLPELPEGVNPLELLKALLSIDETKLDGYYPPPINNDKIT